MFQTFWGGFAFMLTCIMISFVLFFGFGSMIDTLHDTAIETSSNVPADIRDSYDAGHFMINFFYAFVYGIPIFGIAVFIQSILKRERKGQYG